VAGVPGLLADDVGMLVKACQHMLEGGLQNKYDAQAVPISWDQQVIIIAQ